MFLDIEILKLLVKDMGGKVTFDTPCYTKMSPHSHPIRITGVYLDRDEIIAIGGVNIEVDKPSPLCNTLIQRLKLIRHEKLTRK